MDKRLIIRLSIEEHKKIKTFAASSGVSMRSLVLTSSLKRIKELEEEADKEKK